MRIPMRFMDARNTTEGKIVAIALSLLLALPFLSTATFAQRAYADGEEVPAVSEPSLAPDGEAAVDKVKRGDIHGVDFMAPAADDGLWDLFRVENGAGKTLYIEVEKNDKVIAPRFAYVIPADRDTDDAGSEADFAGDNGTSRIAQIVALKIAQPTAAPQDEEAVAPVGQTVQDVFADHSDFPRYTIRVYDAKRQGNQVYEGTISPIYAKLVSADKTEEWKVIGIRTVGADDHFAETVGAGASYYKNITGGNPLAYQCKDLTDTGEPMVALDEAVAATADSSARGQRYVVTYKQVDAAAVSGAVKYVDEQGNIVKTEVVEDIGAGKDVKIEKSFFKKEKPDDPSSPSHYYRVIQRLNGTTVRLTPEQSTIQIRVMEVLNTTAKAYQVTINYVDENNNKLWSDNVDVKGEGYQYTLPNSFSMSAAAKTAGGTITDRDKTQWGVNFYTLSSWTMETNPTNPNEAIDALSVTTEEGNPVIAFEAGEYPAGRTVTAVYSSQETTKQVNLTVVEINGETGALIDKVHYEVTPGKSATYTPAEKDGLVPWSGNMEPITYAWEDLEKGTDVLQYVYYVPEGYTPGDSYDITVQYMNIANSQILDTKTIKVDPETNDFVNILGEERFTKGDDTYVRLAGQETAIRHAYFSPARTYTIYYRDVNDELSSQIVIRRTQIVDTERTVTVPGTTVMTAAPVAAAPAAPAAAPTAPATVDAGVGAGDAQAVINDDDNPLATLGGQDTGTERAIADDENPLSSGLAEEVESHGAAQAAAIAAGVAALAVAGLLLFWWRRKRKQQEPTVIDSIDA